METKVQKKSTPKTALDRVYVDISSEEKESIRLFFSLRGMKQSFLDTYKGQKRRHLDASITSGSYKVGLLKDVRQFIEEHKDEVAEFIKTDAA